MMDMTRDEQQLVSGGSTTVILDAQKAVQESLAEMIESAGGMHWSVLAGLLEQREILGGHKPFGGPNTLELQGPTIRGN